MNTFCYNIWSHVSLCSMIVLFFAYIWYRHRFNYWRNRGIDGPEPVLVFGNLLNMFKERIMIGIELKNLYQKTKHLPFVGLFFFHTPVLFVNDLDLIKAILVKDFAHFMDHGSGFDEKTQPLTNHLFNIKGNKWKSLRNKLSPAFTSSKMKYMFETMAACGLEMTNYLEKEANIGAEVDMKEVAAKYTTDVIASCAFGIDTNCFKYPDAEFRTVGKKVFDIKIKTVIVVFLTIFVPRIQQLFKIKLLDNFTSNFFINAVSNTVKYREENNYERNDLMQLLIRLKNNENIGDNEASTIDNNSSDLHLNTLELTSQAFGFFVAGFETSSTALSYILYQLAENPDIQSDLINEIDDVLFRHNDKITHEALKTMTFMTQVIEETLRMHPPVPMLFRMCTKDYIIPDTKIRIDKGTAVFISILGIQNDPNIYPEPNIFKPDRFSSANKFNRHKCSHLPFGEGPRICIGNKFAYVQMRIALISILKYYTVSPGKNNNLKIAENSILMTPKNMMLLLKKR